LIEQRKPSISKSSRKATARGVSSFSSSSASAHDLTTLIAGPVFFFTHATIPSLKSPKQKKEN
jgi:hypothetical protein